MYSVEDLRKVYDAIGDERLKSLVNIFYDKVENDEVIGHMFEEDTTEGRRWQYLFLKQIFGGPDEYRPIRGQPMMRKRHFPFSIGFEEREAWLKHMHASLDEIGFDTHELRVVINQYFKHMATKVMNKKPEGLMEFNAGENKLM